MVRHARHAILRFAGICEAPSPWSPCAVGGGDASGSSSWSAMVCGLLLSAVGPFPFPFPFPYLSLTPIRDLLLPPLGVANLTTGVHPYPSIEIQGRGVTARLPNPNVDGRGLKLAPTIDIVHHVESHRTSNGYTCICWEPEVRFASRGEETISDWVPTREAGQGERGRSWMRPWSSG